MLVFIIIEKIPYSYISISKALLLVSSVRGVAEGVGGAAGHGADPGQAARHAGVGAGHCRRVDAAGPLPAVEVLDCDIDAELETHGYSQYSAKVRDALLLAY